MNTHGDTGQARQSGQHRDTELSCVSDPGGSGVTQPGEGGGTFLGGLPEMLSYTAALFYSWGQ